MASTSTVRTAATGGPGARSKQAMVYDTALATVVVFGGQGAEGRGEMPLWAWQGGTDDTVAALWKIPFATAHREDVDILRVKVQAVAGGRSGAVADGARLLAWDNLEGDWGVADAPGWRELGHNERGAAAPGPLGWSSGDPELTRRLLLGEEEALDLVLAPRGQSGSAVQPGQLSVDYLEATVRYRVRRVIGWEFDSRCTCRYWHTNVCCHGGSAEDDPVCDGWTPENASTLCATQNVGTWCLDLTAGPARLVSPPFEEEARRYKFLELSAASPSSQVAPTVHLHWQLAGEAGFAEERVIAFPLLADAAGSQHVYRVPLDHPAWL